MLPSPRPDREQPRILVVEDDPVIASMLAKTLEEVGMTARTAESGVEMDIQMRRDSFDLIVLDLMLPGEDGFQICRRLRAQSTIPILMLTAQHEEIDRIVGLEIGADDYVTKPFSTREVVARIRSLLRRASYAPEEGDTSRSLRFDDWTIDPKRRQVRNPGGATRVADHHRVRPPAGVMPQSEPRPVAGATSVAHACRTRRAGRALDRRPYQSASPEDRAGPGAAHHADHSAPGGLHVHSQRRDRLSADTQTLKGFCGRDLRTGNSAKTGRVRHGTQRRSNPVYPAASLLRIGPFRRGDGSPCE